MNKTTPILLGNQSTPGLPLFNNRTNGQQTKVVRPPNIIKKPVERHGLSKKQGGGGLGTDRNKTKHPVFHLEDWFVCKVKMKMKKTPMT